MNKDFPKLEPSQNLSSSGLGSEDLVREAYVRRYGWKRPAQTFFRLRRGTGEAVVGIYCVREE